MASAIIGGLLAKGFATSQFHLVEVNAERRRELQSTLGVAVAAEAGAALTACEVVVFAVKPQHMRVAAQSLVAHLGKQLVISIAAGICLADLSRWLKGYQNLVRVMPNTPALIHAGITGMYALPSVNEAQRQCAATLLEAVGETVWVDNESLLDSVTAVSGSGPAYVFYFIEALQQAAQELGLTPEQGRKLALQTFLGASKLAAQSELSPATLRTQVTSKGGTTERALSVMDEAGLQLQFVAAIKAAAVRSKELGAEFGKD